MCDRHLGGRCAPVDVGDKRQLLLWLQCLLHLCGAQSVQFGLRLALFLCAQVVQEVDILLAGCLSLLAKSSLLHAQIACLSAQSAQSLCHVLAHAKLLSCQVADALSQLLLQLRLLTQDVGLLASDACVLAREPRLLASELAIEARGPLTKLSLLHLLSSQLLANVPAVLCGLKSLLSALRFERAELRAHLPNLTGSGQAELALLPGSAQLALADVLREACALQSQCAQLLSSAQRANACLTQCVCGLETELSALQAVLALHLLIGQAALLLIGQVGQVGLQTCLCA